MKLMKVYYNDITVLILLYTVKKDIGLKKLMGGFKSNYA